MTEPLAIVGPIIDEVGALRRNSVETLTQYDIPFAMSRSATSTEQQLFNSIWKLMRQNLEASKSYSLPVAEMRSDRITVRETTAQAMRDLVAADLRSAVAIMNEQVAELARQQDAAARSLAEHRETVRQALADIAWT